MRARVNAISIGRSDMNRRGFILGALAAPSIIKTPGLLMRIKPPVIYPITMQMLVAAAPELSKELTLHSHDLLREIVYVSGVPLRVLKGSQNG